MDSKKNECDPEEKYQPYKVDKCKFCVKHYWKPWLQELLDLEGYVKEEETAATLNARDAIDDDERKLALRRRQVAAEAILAIRDTKMKVIDAIEAIENEKLKRHAIEQAKYGITVMAPQTETNYKQKIAKAVDAKKMQERKFSVMEEWKNKWKTRRADSVYYRSTAQNTTSVAASAKEKPKPKEKKPDEKKKHKTAVKK